MVWIKSDVKLRSHPKMKRLAKALGISEAAAIGHLHLLWGWAIEEASDGDITDYGEDWISEVTGWHGDPKIFFDAMLNAGGTKRAGFIEKTEDGRVFLHDWQDYTKEYVGKVQAREEQATKRREQGRLRTAKCRERKRVALHDASENDVTRYDEKAAVTESASQDDVTPVTPIDKDIEIETEGKEDPTGSALRAHPHSVTDDGDLIDVEELPQNVQPTVRYLLSRTGRGAITINELRDLKQIWKLHVPARIQREIDVKLADFIKRGRDPTELTFTYLYAVLRNQQSRQRAGKPTAPSIKASEDSYNSMIVDPDEYLKGIEEK